jgi:flavin reductase (DIM6/NTAB) family NADH-FMN oxidoreductase RutF
VAHAELILGGRDARLLTITAFHDLVSALEYPMLVVTAAAGGERAGCLVGFATQCSIDPPRMLVCVSKANHTYDIATKADLLGVHFLRSDDEPLARLFGEETGDEVDKFRHCSWEAGPADVPLLDECAGWFVGRVLERLDCGDHVAHVLEPIASEVREGPAPQLGFQAVKGLSPGHPAG